MPNTGYKQTEEHKRKIGIKSLGHKLSVESKKKIGDYIIGDKNPMKNPEIKAKMIASKKGKPAWNKGVTGMKYPNRKSPPSFTNEHRKNLTHAHLGEKSHLWKGGKTKITKLVRGCSKYDNWRLSVFKRDNFTCKICSKKGGELNADHFPVPFFMVMEIHKISNLIEAIECDSLWDINNGRTLCRECHLVDTGRLLRRKVPATQLVN